MSLTLSASSNLALLNCIPCKDTLFYSFPQMDFFISFFVGGGYSVIISSQHYLHFLLKNVMSLKRENFMHYITSIICLYEMEQHSLCSGWVWSGERAFHVWSFFKSSIPICSAEEHSPSADHPLERRFACVNNSL